MAISSHRSKQRMFKQVIKVNVDPMALKAVFTPKNKL